MKLSTIWRNKCVYENSSKVCTKTDFTRILPQTGIVADHKTNRKSIWWSGEIHRNTSCVIHQIGFASALLTIIILPFLIEVSKLTITYFDHFARNISFTAVSCHLIVIKTNLIRTTVVATNAKNGFKIDHLVIHKHRSTIWTDL